MSINGRLNVLIDYRIIIGNSDAITSFFKVALVFQTESACSARKFSFREMLILLLKISHHEISYCENSHSDFAIFLHKL